MLTKQITSGFEIREMSEEAFWPLWEKYAEGIFTDNSLDFMWRRHISEVEKDQLKELDKNMGEPLQIRLGVFKGEEFVGWSVGDQRSSEAYYMRNSAIRPEFRRLGLYTELLNTKIDLLTKKGFQKIFSRHSSTNNAVIIPKLKAGFVITSMELDDMFGSLIHLSYYTNPLRRKVLEFRTGNLKPDDELKSILGI